MATGSSVPNLAPPASPRASLNFVAVCVLTAKLTKTPTVVSSISSILNNITLVASASSPYSTGPKSASTSAPGMSNLVISV